MTALKLLAVEAVIGVCSVGSCNVSIPVGTIIVPDDFIAHYNVVHMSHGYDAHLVPEFDGGLRNEILEALHDGGFRPHNGGVYIQTTGPRFETKAEVNMF